MNVLGIPLRTPGLSDLLMVALILALASAVGAFCMGYMGWTASEASTAVLGSAGGAMAVACGVSVKEQGLRGALVVCAFVVAAVLVTAALIQLLK